LTQLRLCRFDRSNKAANFVCCQEHRGNHLQAAASNQLEIQTMKSLLLLVAAFGLSGASSIPLTIPPTSASALDGHNVTLPRDLAADATVLILGFSKNSAEATTPWEKAVRTSLASPPSVTFYDIPFLEDAPSFVRPIILRSIRKQVPDIVKPNFVPLVTDEAAWKVLANYNKNSPDAAYVLLVDRFGAIRWQTHDALSPALLTQLSTQAQRLAGTKP
jgi:hypothetical protein